MATPEVYHLPSPAELPPALYARFRAAGPVIPVEIFTGVRGWAVTTHAAVREVLAGDDRRFGKHLSNWAAWREGRVPEGWPLLPLLTGEHMLMRDGADHRRLRGMVSQAFTPVRVEALRPRITEIVDRLVGEVAAAGAGGEPVDLVTAFGERVPMSVICELFGVPEPERSPIRTWTQTLASSQATGEQTLAASAALRAYLADLVADRRAAPGPDLTSALIAVQDGGDRLSGEELVDSLLLLLFAGHETTAHLVGNAVIALLTDPVQLAVARTGGRWADVVEEALRLAPPVAASVFRYALRPVEVAGVAIAEGDPLLLSLTGACTDPGQHGPRADRFDIDRPRKDHLAFGHGPHFCLGAHLGRLEGRIALNTLFTRLPGLRLAVRPDQIPYLPSFLFQGPASLPVLTTSE